jgi:hypothetical protein
MFCPSCGVELDPGSQTCDCGWYSQPKLGDDVGIRMLIPVGRSVWAILAGYFGLFALLVFPAPLALIFGIVALIDMRRHPDRHGMGRAIFGIIMGTLGSLALIVMVVGILFG